MMQNIMRLCAWAGVYVCLYVCVKDQSVRRQQYPHPPNPKTLSLTHLSAKNLGASLRVTKPRDLLAAGGCSTLDTFASALAGPVFCPQSAPPRRASSPGRLLPLPRSTPQRRDGGLHRPVFVVA